MTRFSCRLWRLPLWLLSSMLLVTLAACQSTAAPAPTSAAALLPTSLPTVAATATPTPSLLPPATPTPSPLPSATPSPTPTATPLPQLSQVTEGGCCTQPFWSPDGRQVRFIDKPAADQPVGIWGVDVSEPLTAPQFVSARLEESTASPEYLIETGGERTVIERRSDGTRWEVPAAGRPVSISPNAERIAWSVSTNDNVSSQQAAILWLAKLDGSAPRQIAELPRGGLSGWISNDVLLVSYRESQEAREQILAALNVSDGSQVELVRAERLRGQLLSPSGGWLVYYIAFDPDTSRNGLWLVRTDGSAIEQLDAALFGSYQWRPCAERCTPEQDRLLLVPFEMDAPWQRLVQFNPATGEAQSVTDPETTPFKIANGDWRASPDGRLVAFVAAQDRNIWLLPLGER